jgi:hypothetical protein
MEKLGKDLEFISRIKRDGSGTEPITDPKCTFLLEEKFKINTLSLSRQTYIASGFYSYVVKLKHQPAPEPAPEPDYFKDLEKWEESFWCNECGEDKMNGFYYDRTVANGEVWICRNCKNQTMVNEQPNEDNY